MTNDFNGAVGLDYYGIAETMMGAAVTDLDYFVFSDVMNWCRENITFANIVTYASHHYGGNKFQDYLRLVTV